MMGSTSSVPRRSSHSSPHFSLLLILLIINVIIGILAPNDFKTAAAAPDDDDLPSSDDDPYHGMGGEEDPYATKNDESDEISTADVTELRSVADVNELINPSDENVVGGAVIGVFFKGVIATKEKDDSEVDSDPDYTSFRMISERLLRLGYRVGSSRGIQEVSQRYGVTGTSPTSQWRIYVELPERWMSEKHGETTKRFRYPGSDIGSPSAAGSLHAFVRERYTPLVSRVSRENEGVIRDRGLPVLVLVTPLDPKRDPKGLAYHANRLRKSATGYKGRVVFALMDPSDGELTRWFPFFSQQYNERGEGASGTRRLVGIKDGERYYVASASVEFSSEAIGRFIEDFVAGKLEATVVKDDPELDGRVDAAALAGAEEEDAILKGLNAETEEL